MNTLDIVFGNSCYQTIKNSKINNEVLMINALFNIADLSNIENFEITIPQELYFEKSNIYFKDEYDIIISNIKKGNKIRVWTSKNDIYSYLIMLYTCSIINKNNYELYVLYSEDYIEDYPSPSVMREYELEKLSRLEHKLTKDEIKNFADTWGKIVSENAELRIIEKGKIKSVHLDYYDSYILETLQNIGKVKISKLVGNLMKNIYLNDKTYTFLINRLIKDNKIKITLDKSVRYFENLIEINNNY